MTFNYISKFSWAASSSQHVVGWHPLLQQLNKSGHGSRTATNPFINKTKSKLVIARSAAARRMTDFL
jgi:hypothetical protein